MIILLIILIFLISVSIFFFLFFLTLKINKMADNLDDLSAQVDELQTALDAEQQKVLDAVDALNAVVTDLKSQIGGVLDKAKIQAISDKVAAIKTDLESSDLDGSDQPPV